MDVDLFPISGSASIELEDDLSTHSTPSPVFPSFRETDVDTTPDRENVCALGDSTALPLPCHAGGRGFESRRSRHSTRKNRSQRNELRALSGYQIMSCLSTNYPEFICCCNISEYGFSSYVTVIGQLRVLLPLGRTSRRRTGSRHRHRLPILP